jgi:polar amino acid transport system substrate-binding protein
VRQIWLIVASLPVVMGLTGLAAEPSPTPPPATHLHELLPQRYRTSGVINLATEGKYPPFESFADDGKTLVGYEVDLWNEMGRRLGVRINAIPVDFASLIPGVQAGRWDIAVESIDDNPERQKVVSFVDYGYARAAAYALEGHKSITDNALSLCGMRGATQSGTDFWLVVAALSKMCARAGAPPPTSSEYGSSDAVLLALYSGRVDFVATDAASVAQVAAGSNRPILAITDRSFPPPTIAGIVFRKTDPELGNALRTALRSMYADGTYAKIFTRWGVAMNQLDMQPGINLAKNNER